MRVAERYLPADLLNRASLHGEEYAWPLHDIPEVIEAARRADLVSIGGQLQFRLPDAGVCECYWVEVDTHRSVPKALPWSDRVEETAKVALAAFNNLSAEYDFLAEGRRGFADHLQAFEAQGQDPRQVMCFVWYVESAANDGANP